MVVEFRAQMFNVQTLKKIFEVLKPLLEMAVLVCSPTGIRLRSMDNAHVAIIDVKLNADGFETYFCLKKIELCIRVESLIKILGTASLNDTTSIEYDPLNPNVLNLKFTSEVHSQQKILSHDLKLINFENLVTAIPGDQYDYIVCLPSNVVYKTIDDWSKFNDRMTIKCDGNSITFSVTCVENNSKASFTLTEEAMIHQPGHGQPTKAVYSSIYLAAFSKAFSFAANVRIYHGEPIMFEYVIGNLGHVRFYLASKVPENADG